MEREYARGMLLKPIKGAAGYPLPAGFNGRLRRPYLWFSGRPLNGHRYTDATGFRYGTMATDISGRAPAYHYLPGYKKFLYARVPAMASPFVATLAVATPVELAWTVATAGTLAIPGVAKTLKVAKFRREVVEPLAVAVARTMKIGHEAGRGHLRVDIPHDFRDNEMATVAIRIPVGWTAEDGDMARVDKIVAKHLQVDELVATWHVHGHKPHVKYALPVKPVAKLSFAEGVELATQTDGGQVAMGAGPRGALVTFDLALESPHLLIAGGSGAGKSELLAFLVGQFMRAGYGVAVLDAKFTSHMWLRRVPGVLYAAEAEELHETLLWLDRELLRRARFVAAGGNPEELVPMVALLEEMNGATNRLRAYWASIKVNGDPAMSPAITALGNLSSMGRELRMHILMAGQSMTAKGTGGAENRENFGARTLARATANQWRMLAPQIKPAPTKRQKPGRWHVVVGDTIREYQAPFMEIKTEPERLIEWATNGTGVSAVDVPAMMAGVVMTRSENTNMASSESVSSGTAVALSDYVQDRPGLTLTQLNNWRQRYAADFPDEVGTRGKAKLYELADLDSFVSQRVT